MPIRDVCRPVSRPVSREVYVPASAGDPVLLDTQTLVSGTAVDKFTTFVGYTHSLGTVSVVSGGTLSNDPTSWQTTDGYTRAIWFNWTNANALDVALQSHVGDQESWSYFEVWDSTDTTLEFTFNNADASFSQSSVGYASTAVDNWAWTGVTTNPFPSGSTHIIKWYA